jgi:hypothetical protein
MSLARIFSFGAGVLVACGEESALPQQQPLTAALERPFEACQERFETCRVAPGADPAACQASMRGCLEEVATWMQKSRALIEMCRAEATQCRISQPLPQSSMCDQQFEACVAPAFQPGASDEDAGVPADHDAGAPPPADPGAAGRGPGPGRPRLPPRVPMIPTQPTPADACRSELLECLSPSADLAACATRARDCLRASLIPTF